MTVSKPLLNRRPGATPALRGAAVGLSLLWAALACTPLLAPANANASTTVLYDPALGTLPAQQGWVPLALGAAATQAVVGNVYTLDTTGPGVGLYGHGLQSPVALDTQAGFELQFSLQVLSETHSSPNRSGYSVVMVGNNPQQALELAFWTDRVWAYDYDALQADRFVRGVQASFDTTSALHQYTLRVQQQQYGLWVNGQALLSGGLHDYTADGVPYTVPNFIFFGDDSSRGNSNTRLGAVTLGAASPAVLPEPASAALVLAALALMRGVRSSRAVAT
jgi:hypothetical protein